MNPLEHILPLLHDKDASQLQNITQELQDAWEKQQIFRTETEARFGVLNSFKYPTKAAKYWQSVREQMCHFQELTSLSFELRRKKIELEECTSKIEEKIEEMALPNVFSNRENIQFNRDLARLEVDRDELLFCIASGEQVAQHRVREIMQWSTIKKEMNDGSFDDKDVNTHQRESLFKSTINRKNVAPQDLSAEERLSMDGLLHDLSKEEVNQKVIEQLEGRKNDTV